MPKKGLSYNCPPKQLHIPNDIKVLNSKALADRIRLEHRNRMGQANASKQ